MNVPSSPYAQVFDTLIGILRFRKGPEDMPASGNLLVAMIIGGVALRAIALVMTPDPGGNPAVLIGLEIGVMLLGLKLALRLARHPERFTQTATAWLGAQLVAGPAVLLTRWLILSHNQPQDPMTPVAQVLFLVVAVWMLIVTVRILRSATEWPLFACILLALAIELFTAAVVMSLYPPATEAAATTTT